MPSLRTPEGKKIYQDHLEAQKPSDPCALCAKGALKDFAFWKVTDNSFPYDKIAKTHHMLVPRRHVSEKELSREELEELRSIKDSYINEGYDWIIEATRRSKSIPDHFHLHLIVGK